AYHLSRITGDNGRADDAVGARLHVNLGETGSCAVENSSINMGKVLPESLNRQTLCVRLFFRKTDLRHFWVGVCACGDDEGADLFSSQKECVLNDNAGHGIGRVSELVA